MNRIKLVPLALATALALAAGGASAHGNPLEADHFHLEALTSGAGGWLLLIALAAGALWLLRRLFGRH